MRLREGITDLDATNEQLSITRDRLLNADNQCEALLAEKALLEQRVSKLGTELELHAGSVDELSRQLATKSEQHEAAVGKLQSELAELESLRAEKAVLRAKTTDLISHLKRISVEHEDSLQANERAQKTIRELQNEVHKQTSTIRTLRRERAAIDDLDDDDSRNVA